MMIKTFARQLGASTGLLIALMATPPVWAQGGSINDAAVVTTEARNRALILRFYYEFFNQHNINYADEVVREDYIQHNPNLATGREALKKFFQTYFSQSPQSVSEIDHLAAEGDLVWVHTHQIPAPGQLGQATMDIYRIRDGKIAEHWDVVEPVPSTSANGNTMF
ncbi:nuclear transport factor 2 family protein [Paraburkholderia sp. IMGN_8]|uniref:nuclear transport factor 2 family protein n=1 Tax=Paraburkholderia sp. IMGN_8 TaxID=3136564 RepID=UPI003100F388